MRFISFDNHSVFFPNLASFKLTSAQTSMGVASLTAAVAGGVFALGAWQVVGVALAAGCATRYLQSSLSQRIVKDLPAELREKTYYFPSADFKNSGDFWRMIRDILEKPSEWDDIEINGTKISKEIVEEIASLKLLLTPSHIPEIVKNHTPDQIKLFCSNKELRPIVYGIIFDDVSYVTKCIESGKMQLDESVYVPGNYVSNKENDDSFQKLQEMAIAFNAKNTLLFFFKKEKELGFADAHIQMFKDILGSANNTLEEKAALFDCLIEQCSDQELFQFFSHIRPVVGINSEEWNMVIGKFLSRIAENPDPKLLSETIEGVPLFFLVIAFCDEKAALYFLRKGVDPNLETAQFRISALHLAAKRGYFRLIEALLEKNARCDKDFSGHSYLSYMIEPRSFIDPDKFIEDHFHKEENFDKWSQFLIYDAHKSLGGTDWTNQYLKKYPLDAHEAFTYKQLYRNKMCAHLFDVGGKMQYFSAHARMRGEIMEREGAFTPHTMAKKVAKCLKNEPNPKMTQETVKELVGLCEFASCVEKRPEEHVQRILEGKPTFVLSHSKGHSWNALFYNDYFVLCNHHKSNEKMVQFYTYDKNKLDARVIENLMTLSIFDSNAESERRVKEMISLLDAKVVEKDFTYQKQKVGNCVWKSFEWGVDAFLFLKNDTEYLNTNWKIDVQLHYGRLYLKFLEKEDAIYNQDTFLIQSMIAQLESKKESASLEPHEKEKIAAFIEKATPFLDHPDSKSDEKKFFEPILKDPYVFIASKWPTYTVRLNLPEGAA